MVCGTVTSDSCGWLQIYGTGSALGSSLLVIGAVGLGDTSDGVAYLLPYTTALIHVEGMYVVLGSTSTSATFSSAATSDTVPHIAIYQWPQNSAMFMGAVPGTQAGDIGISMLLNEGFAAMSGLLFEYNFTGSAS